MSDDQRTGATKKITIGLVAAAAIIAALAFLIIRGCDSGDGQKPDFTIAMVTFPGYAPLYLAESKGMFGDLDVNLVRIEDISSIRAAVRSGDAEAYLATLDIAFDSDTRPLGTGVWVIDESSGGDAVIVRDGIDSVEQLRGQTVAAEPGFPPNFLLMYALNEAGLSLADVEFRDMSTQNAAIAFAAGSVQAAGVYEPYLTTALNSQEGSRVVVSSADTPGLIVDLIFVSEDVLADRKGDVQLLIDGWNQALDYIRDNPDDAYSIMAAAFGIPVEEFREIAAGVVWLGPEQNRDLYGTAAQPGPLYDASEKVVEILTRNRSTVFQANPTDHLTREFQP